MTDSIECRIMNALAARLDNMPGVQTFTLDPTRVISESDGVTVALEQGLKDDNDRTNDACWITSSFPVVISIYVPRPQNQNPAIPGDLSSTPVWQLVDLFRREIHVRMMADLPTRQIQGLALDTTSVTRQRESEATITALRMVYSVTYRTSHPSIAQ